MKHLFYLGMLALTSLPACTDSPSNQANLLSDAPVVATRILIDGEECIKLDPSLLEDTVVFPLSHFIEKPEIIKLDDKDEALTGSPFAYVSEHHILTVQMDNTPYKLFDRQGNFITNIGSIGQGPGEYRSIYSAVLDEHTRRVYLLPFFGNSVLVYDFQGNVCPPIPLVHEGIVGQIALRGDTLLVMGSPQPKRFASSVWIQDLKGNLIKEIPTSRLDFDFRGVLVVSNQNRPNYADLSFWIPKAQQDSLYEVSIEKGQLIPRFTAHFQGDALVPHMYGEFPGYFVGEATGQWMQTRKNDDGKIERRIVGETPSYYIVDKKTLKGAYLVIENDFLGGIRLPNPMAMEKGGYSPCFDPGDLREMLEDALRSDRLTEEQRKYLSDILANIDENDNNYILYGKMKQD